VTINSSISVNPDCLKILTTATHTAIQGPFGSLCQTGAKRLLWS